MKKVLFVFLMFVGLIANSQDDCSNYGALGFHYTAPKSVGFDGMYVTDIGFTATIGVAVTYPDITTVQKGLLQEQVVGNMADIYTIVGWRVIRKDFKYSVYLNGGVTVGDLYNAQPLVSARLALPMDQKCMSIEPMYIFNRGATVKISLHFKM